MRRGPRNKRPARSPIRGHDAAVPDSEANAAVVAHPSAGPRGDGAFPQIRKLSLVELGTHVELAFVVRSIAHGEQSMVRGLLRHLTPEMLLLEDRGFFSYDHWKDVTSRGVKLLGRVKKGLILEPIRNRADGFMLRETVLGLSRRGLVIRVGNALTE